MSSKVKIILFTALLLGAGLLVSVFVLLKNHGPASQPAPPTWPEVSLDAPSNSPTTLRTSTPVNANPIGVKRRSSELTADQMSRFRANFEASYRPAILAWGQAYAGHLPFSPEAITAANFVERIGRDFSYNEYIFVIDGVTLGVRDSAGTARVDYLNVPAATARLGALAREAGAPTLQSPVNRGELSRILKIDTGFDWKESDIRMIPTGVSGALNGGVNVIVGGDINDFVSWKYNIIFGPDGKMVYYLKGHE